MTKNNIELWAVSEIQKIDPSFGDLNQIDQLNENLFTSGRLDSMNLMALLLGAESEFSFRFTPESFQDRRLYTVSGLSDLIAELKISQ